LVASICCAAVVSCSESGRLDGAGDVTATSSLIDTNQLRVYAVQKKVADFPAAEDLSTPEAAYATCNRISASGDEGAWRRLSVERFASRLPAEARKREVSPNAAKEWLEAEVVEARIYRDTYAAAFARVPHAWKQIIDVRSFEREGGQWRNSGNCVVGSLDEARAMFLETLTYHAVVALRDSRKPLADPATHLDPFVAFLHHEGRDPKALLLEAVTKHPIAVVGELHHRPAYWEFNCSLVADPDFVDQVGTIYLELPQNDQPLVDRFLAASKLDIRLLAWF
jgi:hypothetical protein